MPRPALPTCTWSPREGVVAAVQGPGLCRQNSCKGPRGATAHPSGGPVTPVLLLQGVSVDGVMVLVQSECWGPA